MCVMDPAWTPLILVPIVAFLMGLRFGGAQMMPWIIFPDTVVVAQMATGERPTGTYSGMMTLARKTAGAIGVGLIGWILDPIGYVSNDSGDPTKYIPQTEEVLLAIRLLMGLAIVVFISVALWASFNYKITNKKLARVRYFIEARKNGTVLSEEEEAERTALVHELYGKTDPGGYPPAGMTFDDQPAEEGDVPEAAFGVEAEKEIEESDGEVFVETAEETAETVETDDAATETDEGPDGEK